MNETKHQPPSRIRYEKSHPCVTCRVSQAEYDQLDKIRQTQGKSFRQLLLTGAQMIDETVGDQEAAYREGWDDAKKDPIPLGVCPSCGKPMTWKLANEKDRQLLAETIETAGIAHSKCPKKPD
jgi:hypothetical protein